MRTRLRRFHEAVSSLWRRGAARARSADWATIGTEIAIVVLGILIAFQLDRWGEGWRKAADEQVFLERLEEESRDNVAAIARIIDQDRTNLNQLRHIIRAVEQPPLRPHLSRRPNFGCGMLHLPATRTRRSYQHLVGSEAVERGRDPQLRSLIGAALAAEHFADRQLDYFRGGFQRFGGVLDDYALWRVDPVTGAYGCTIDVARLAANPRAVRLLGRVYRDRHQFLTVRNLELEAQRNLRRRAGCLVQRSC